MKLTKKMDDYYDANFEADCPKFVDFTVPQNLEDNADEWFSKFGLKDLHRAA